MERPTNSGYHACPCRDCFEIAIGCDDDNNPDLCHECETAGCDADGESECDVEREYYCASCDARIEQNHELCMPCAKRDDVPDFHVNPTPES